MKFDRENFILNYFSVEWEDLLKIDELNVDNSTKMYLDKINICYWILMHLLKELINTIWSLIVKNKLLINYIKAAVS